MNLKFTETYNTRIRESNTGACYWDDTLLYKYNDDNTCTALVIPGCVADFADDIPFTGDDLIDGKEYPGCYMVNKTSLESVQHMTKHQYKSVWFWDDTTWITNGPGNRQKRP